MRQVFVMELSDPNILNFKLDVTVVNETQTGIGVLRYQCHFRTLEVILVSCSCKGSKNDALYKARLSKK